MSSDNFPPFHLTPAPVHLRFEYAEIESLELRARFLATCRGRHLLLAEKEDGWEEFIEKQVFPKLPNRSALWWRGLESRQLPPMMSQALEAMGIFPLVEEPAWKLPVLLRFGPSNCSGMSVHTWLQPILEGRDVDRGLASILNEIIKYWSNREAIRGEAQVIGTRR